MAITIISTSSYESQPCQRCGSKRRVSKAWKETVATFSGTTEVSYTQIICTNSVCQEAFEKKLLKDTQEQAKIKQKREEAQSEREKVKAQQKKDKNNKK